MKTTPSKALLVILDGYGISVDPDVSAIEKAKKPFIDSLFARFPHAQLSASGKSVGLPEGQFGNSEVGHLNIGAGRVVWQELSRINQAIEDGSFYENEVLTNAFEHASDKGRIHIMGLFSDGGVHSHNNHLFALLEMSKKYNLDNTYVHAFTDGRDTSPHGGLEYCKEFRKEAEKIGTGKLASIVGRYFAMDRDNRWERTEKAYNLLVHGKGKEYENPESVFENSYENNITDEFLEPHLLKSDDESRIQKGDTIIFYNFRGDRMRQLNKALLRFEEVEFETDDLDLNIASFTSYDDQFSDHIQVAYPPADLKNTLGEYVSRLGLRQLRIAETEKYPHVTYFFNGGVEEPNKNEDRIMVPSPKVATYDLQPEMSAPEVADKLSAALESEKYHLAILNFANPDMVGHTGVMDAVVKAIETIDSQLKKVIETATDHNYKVLIIADHGNSDRMIEPDGSPHTAHTTAPVPVLLIGEDKREMQNGILADVAPTLLKMMNLDQPQEMSGKPLY